MTTHRRTHPAPTSVDAGELADSGEQGRSVLRFDRARLRSPVVVRAATSVGAATAFLVWPARTDAVLARMVGLGIALVACVVLRDAVRSRRHRGVDIGLGVGGLVLAVGLFMAPDVVVVARLVGVFLLAVAARRLLHLRQREERTVGSWMVARLVPPVASAALVLMFPEAVLATFVTAIAIASILAGTLAFALALDPSTELRPAPTVRGLLTSWVEDRPKAADDRRALYDRILFDGPETRSRVARFFVLMGLASVIAALGVVGDSTPLVLAAMLIAPLMRPLMGMAISVVMGWPNRLSRSVAIAGGGVGVALVVGALVGLISPGVVDPATNEQILSRTSPTLIDLAVAVAAGAAGAYGLSRRDLADALPGVAVAISLVPPLSVAGVVWSAGMWEAGAGALLLFAANLLAIVSMGGLTFILTGVTPLRRVAESQRRMRTALAVIGGLAALVLGGLLLNGQEKARNLFDRSKVEDVVGDWLGDSTDYSIAQVTVDGDTVEITIVGPADDPPNAASLAAELSARLERRITADVRLLVQERQVVKGEE